MISWDVGAFSPRPELAPKKSLHVQSGFQHPDLLVPMEALLDAADHFLRREGFRPSPVLEKKIGEAE